MIGPLVENLFKYQVIAIKEGLLFYDKETLENGLAALNNTEKRWLDKYDHEWESDRSAIAMITEIKQIVSDRLKVVNKETTTVVTDA